jgi:asparagine synthase (glutamine-hydrolysing)
VLEFAASLPPSSKLNGFTPKYILKKAMARKIPKEILNRKKVGFPVPYESWLRNDLKDVVWDILTDRKTIQRGYFRKEAVEDLLRANSNGSNYSKEIFSLLNLELWQRTFLEREQVVL